MYRYHALVVKTTLTSPLGGSVSSGCIVPSLSGPVAEDDDDLETDAESHSLVTIDPTKRELEALDPSLQKLQDIDPFLVFLCYRGFNHIAGKIQSGMFS